MSIVVFGFPGCAEIAAAIVSRTGAMRGELVLHRFPDGESHVRLATPVSGHKVILACSLHQPDEKLLPLAFAAATARELGATGVGVVAPYLGYMRQDGRFLPGEAITSATFAKILSGFADWMVTVDPHLHRYRALAEIYSMKTAVVHAAPAVSQWIREHVAAPLIVGPDSESEQWAADIARRTGAPHIVLQKVRHGDAAVEVSLQGITAYQERAPVLVDDIISTGGTMIAAVRCFRRLNMRAPVCIAVHAIFAGDAYIGLRSAGAERIVTCNTIAHPTNAIDLNEAIAAEVPELAF